MADKEPDPVLLEKHDGMGVITFNRPHKANALRLADYELYLERVNDCDRDDDVRVIIVTGAGEKYFTVGDDFTDYANPEVAKFRDLSPLERHNYVFPMNEVGRVLWNSDKPSIAAINGACMMPELIWWCDLRIMAEGASILERNIHIGVTPGCGGTQLMTRLVGRARALELLLLGEPIGAEDALRLGVVNKVVPLAELMPAAEEWAKKIMRASPTAAALARFAVNASQDVPLEWGMQLEKFASYSSELTGDIWKMADEFMKAKAEKKSS